MLNALGLTAGLAALGVTGTGLLLAIPLAIAFSVTFDFVTGGGLDKVKHAVDTALKDNKVEQTGNPWDDVPSIVNGMANAAVDIFKDVMDVGKTDLTPEQEALKNDIIDSGYTEPTAAEKDAQLQQALAAEAESVLNGMGLTFEDLVENKKHKKALLDPNLFASGGIVDQGQMFIARENGAELVGNIGNRTAVMNNDQIVQAVSQGVYEAVTRASGNGDTTIQLVVDGEVFYSKILEKNRREMWRENTSGGALHVRGAVVDRVPQRGFCRCSSRGGC